MGGGGIVTADRPPGAAVWCSGDDVIKTLNDLFHQDPINPQYQAAKSASLTYFQIAARSGMWGDLWTAYGRAFDAAGIPLCPGWSTYLDALGNMSPSGNNSGTMVTTASTPTSSAILTFSNVANWIANDLNVSDSSNPSAINGSQTVSDFTTTTVTLTANVNATVNAGDIIAFSLPGGQGNSNIRTIAQARCDGLQNNVRMKTFKHHPHDPHSSGHRVRVTRQPDGSIDINSPYVP
jgi:hypothetical protein